MTERRAEVLMVVIILARSTSYLFSKLGLQDLGTYNLIALRFFSAFIILSIIFWKKMLKVNWKLILSGILIGLMTFLAIQFELMSLKTTDTSTTSFLESITIVFISLIESVLRKKLPQKMIIFSTAIAMAGVALLTLKASLSMTSGEIFALLGALSYALLIIFTDRFAENDDPITLGIVQVGFVGIMGIAMSFAFETPHLPTTHIAWAAVAALSLICTVVGFTFQPLVQKYMSSEKAGLFLALNPVSASILGIIFLGEGTTTSELFGAGMVLVAVILASTVSEKEADIVIKE